MRRLCEKINYQKNKRKVNSTRKSQKTKRGKIFYGCNNYPKCDFATWDKPTGEICPDCNSPLVETKDKIKCSKCAYER